MHHMITPDAMKKMMRARVPNEDFVWDVKASHKPAKRSIFIGYVNGKRAQQKRKRKG
jgi:hypothetical protein